MKKKLLFAFVALLTTASAWADVWQDPETKVNYKYTVGESKASVKGSPDATGAITILQKFSVDEKEYTVTSIGNSAFNGCTGLTSITIPESVTSIGAYVFKNCTSLTSITIPEGVISIDIAPFAYCTNLTSITVDAGNKKFDSRGNCNAIIETATNTLLHGCPSTVIPNDVTKINSNAFYGCNGLTSITIPESVTSIDINPFQDCANLTSITVDADNKFFDSRGNCNAIIETATNTLLSGCSSTVIPNDVTCIGQRAFYYCSSLTNIIIPESVTSISKEAFQMCTSLISITIPEGVTRIDYRTFWGCYGLTNIKIPESVTFIGIEAFEDCSGLTSINIPEGLTTIGQSAFSGCKGLTSISIPESVTGIYRLAFSGCVNLTTVISYIKEPFNAQGFYYVPSSCTLYVPVGTKAKYETTDGWKEFKNIVEFSNASVTLTKEIETFTNVLPLDFTTPVSGLKAYTVKEVSEGKAVLEEVTGAVPTGTGLILKGTPGETYELPYATKAPLPVENKLVGVLADTEIGGNDVDYILQDGKFVKAVTGTLKAGKAYLKLDAALAREIIEIDGETTGISLVENGKRDIENVFDLQGRRVSKPSKGMYIVNGKKVIMN